MLKSHLSPLPGQVFLPSGLHVLPSTYLSLQERDKRGRNDDVVSTSLSSMAPHPIENRTAEQGDCRPNEKEEGMKGRMTNGGGGEKNGESILGEGKILDVNPGDNHASLSQSSQDVPTSSRALPPSAPSSLGVASSSFSPSKCHSSSSVVDEDKMKSTSAAVFSSRDCESHKHRSSRAGSVEGEKGMIDAHVKSSSSTVQRRLLSPAGEEFVLSATPPSSSSLLTGKEEGGDQFKPLVDTSSTHTDRHVRGRRLSDYTAVSPLVRCVPPGGAPRTSFLHSQIDATEEGSRQEGERGLSERRRRSYAGEERSPPEMISHDAVLKGGDGVLVRKKQENRRALLEDKKEDLVRENKQEGEREKENGGEEGEMRGESSSKSDVLDCLNNEDDGRTPPVTSGEIVESMESASRGGEEEREQGKVRRGEEEEGLMTDENDAADRGDDKDRIDQQETKKNAHERKGTDNNKGKDDPKSSKTEEERQAYSSIDKGGDESRLLQGKDAFHGGEDQQDEVEMNESSTTSALITSMDVEHDMTAEKKDGISHKKEEKEGGKQIREEGGTEEEQGKRKGGKTEENQKTCDAGKNRHGDDNMNGSSSAGKEEETGPLAVLVKGLPETREFLEIEDVKRKNDEKDLGEREHQEKSAMMVLMGGKSSELDSRKVTSSSSHSSLIAVEVENLLWRFAALVEEKKAMYVHPSLSLLRGLSRAENRNLSFFLSCISA